jgi:hypothetical protein
MRKLIVHLGYPKTGTTTIQRNFFSNHRRINYLGRPFDRAEIEKALYIISDFDDIVFNEYLNFIISVFDSNLADDKISVLSSEHHTHKFTLVLGGASERNMGLIAKRLYQIFELMDNVDVRFLFTIRRQIEMFESYYVQKYNDFKKTDINTFDKLYKFSIDHQDQGLMLALNYDKIISFYCDLFGSNKVTVLVFEEFIADRLNYCNKLAILLNIDEREILSLLSAQKENISNKDKEGGKFKYSLDEKNSIYIFLRSVYKKINYTSPLILKLKNRILKFFYIKTEAVRLDKNQKKNLKNIFKKSNHKVSSKNNLDLQRFDYF